MPSFTPNRSRKQEGFIIIDQTCTPLIHTFAKSEPDCIDKFISCSPLPDEERDIDASSRPFQWWKAQQQKGFSCEPCTFVINERAPSPSPVSKELL